MTSNKNENIQVVVRCRPLSAAEKKQGSGVVDVNPDRREVTVRERHSVRTFSYDRVFGPASKQIEVYKSTVVPILKEVLLGYNCTIFAYGQTGTGKTFTMEGERTAGGSSYTWEDDPLAGIVPRAMHQLFNRLQRQGGEFSVRVSYMELYNEELVDLLGAESVDNPRLKIYEDRKGACVIQGLEEVVVVNQDQVYAILAKGSARRQTAATLMNSHSSRSHSVFMVTIHTKENSVDGEELLRTGKLNLVDLAGSECIGRSGAVDRRAREAGSINQSLLTLGRVITALVEHAPHIPYRESKLTRLLQDSLGGRTKTCIIATISPAAINVDETLCTLDYVHRAKNILNRPEVNQKTTKKALLKEYTEEIERLRRDLQANRDKNGIYMAEENYHAMQSQIGQQGDHIGEMMEKIDALNAEILKVMDLFSDARDDLCERTEQLSAEASAHDATRTQLGTTRDELGTTRTDLRTVRRHRDEQRHLVGAHVTAETTLHGEATQLLDSVTAASGDVLALHDKVDRTRVVDRVNAAASDDFHAQLSTAVADMQRHLVEFSDGQQRETREACTVIDRLLTERSDAGSQLTSALRHVSDTLTRRGAQLHVTQVTRDAAASRWMSDVERRCAENKEDVSCSVAEFESTHSAVLQAAVDRLLQAELGLGRLTELLREQAKSHASRVDAFAAEVKTSAAQQVALLQRMSAARATAVDSEKQRLAAMRRRQRGVNKKLLEMIAEQETMFCEETEALEAGLNEVQREGEEHGEDAVRQIEEMGARNTQYCTEVTRCIGEHCDEASAVCEEVGRHTAVVTKSHTALMSDVATFTERAQTVLSTHSDVVSRCVSEFNAAATIDLEQHSADTKALLSGCQQQLESVRSEQAKCSAQLKAGLAARRLHLVAAADTSAAWVSAAHSETGAIGTLAESFLQHELQRNVTTGLTPARRDLRFPLALTRTDRHSLLLADFRSSYDLEQAVNTPIPDDSFCDEQDESATDSVSSAGRSSPPLTTPSGRTSPPLISVGGSESRMSSDSAISSAASVTSTGSRKTSPSRSTDSGRSTSVTAEDKENSVATRSAKMGPPSAVKAPGAAGRARPPGARTPQKSAARPARGVTTPRSGSRTRTRLPLKPSNP